jgi:hypothetical protein
MKVYTWEELLPRDTKETETREELLPRETGMWPAVR